MVYYLQRQSINDINIWITAIADNTPLFSSPNSNVKRLQTEIWFLLIIVNYNYSFYVSLLFMETLIIRVRQMAVQSQGPL